MDKKSIIINPTEHLNTVLEKICFARGMNLDAFIALDGSGCVVSLDKPLGEIEGRCITLVTEGDLKKVNSEPELPTLEKPTSEHETFLFPLPHNPLAHTLPPEPQDTSRKHQNRKSMIIGKSLSSSFIPRAWSPRNEKVGPSSMPCSTTTTPRDPLTSSSSATTPRTVVSRPISRSNSVVLKVESVDANHVMEGVETEFAVKTGPPAPLYVPAPPPERQEEKDSKSEKRKQRRSKKLDTLPIRPKINVNAPSQNHTLKKQDTQKQRERSISVNKAQRRSSKLNLPLNNKENQLPVSSQKDVL